MSPVRSSFQLLSQSFAILKKDKELIWFSLFSLFLNILALVVCFLGPFYLFIVNLKAGGVENQASFQPYMYGFIPLFLISTLLFYILSSFITTFFKAGLMTCVNIRLDGGNPTFRDGFSKAQKHIGEIFIWSLLSGTVVFIFRTIFKNERVIFKIFGSVSLVSWSLINFFIIPVMIFNDLTIKESIKKSGELFNKTWGKSLTGQFSMRLIFVILWFAAFPFVFIGGIIGSNTTNMLTDSLIFSLIIFYFVGVAVFFHNLQSIYVTALYNYATTGKSSIHYDPMFIRKAYYSNLRDENIQLD
ncbi:DUF6159 family protein [Patescibacteria group bacterium]